MSKTIKLCILLVASMLTTNLSATYYIAGNGEEDPNHSWCNNSNWGFQALDANNSITFSGVGAGMDYGFKIKDADNWSTGSEYTIFDYNNSDLPLYGGNGSDMTFRLSEDADVTISVVDGKVRVHASKPLAYISNYYYIVGNGSGAWCNGQDWGGNADANKFINDELSYTSLPAGWYEFKVIKGNWDKSWGYPELDVAKSSPMHKTYGEGGNICFRLQAAADVTVKMEKGKVVLLIDRELSITGNGADAGNGAWLAGHNWWAKNDDAKLDANYSRTYYNLPVGSYQFKVKENVDDTWWPDDCTWGYDHLDTENSNAGEDWTGNIGFNLSLPADVTIAIVNNKIRLNTSPVYFIAGNGDESHGDWCNQKGWWQDEPNSRLDATTLSKTYTALPAGYYEFKLTNGRWADNDGTVWAANAVDNETSSRGYRGAGDDANIEFDLQAPTDVTISFNPETGKISLVSSNGYFLSNVYSVVGNEDLVGFDWANMETSTEMTNNGDGTYTYTINDKYLAAGNYDYKIIGGHRWGKGCEYPNTNATLSIAEAGLYTIVFTLNPVAETQTCVATPVTKDITISQYQFNTFYANKAYTVPEGLQAFIYTGIEGDMLVMDEINVIPASTGVVLYGAANANYTLPATQTDVTYTDNLLKGTVDETEIAANGKVHYVLSLNDEGQVGLYWPNGTTEGVGAFTNHAGKAYLELPSGAANNIRGFVLRGTNGTTAIEDIVAPQADDQWYDLLGRPVDQPTQSGVYIHQGKKVVIL